MNISVSVREAAGEIDIVGGQGRCHHSSSKFLNK